MSNDCFFCEDYRFHLNIKTGLPGEDSVIYEDDHIYIAPDIAPLAYGHFLIITKKHFNSFGNASDDAYESLLKAKAYVKTHLFADINVSFLEHGAVVEGSGGASIDHAHMHIIPSIIGYSVNDYIIQCGLVASERVQATRQAVRECATKHQPYIYYDTIEDGEWLYPVDYLPSQFFRAMVAQKLSTNHNWKINYKQNSSKDLFLKTLEFAKKRNVDRKRLYDVGEKDIVNTVIYGEFPHLRDVHDDAVVVDVKKHDYMVMSTDPCPEPIVCAFDMSNFYYHYGKMSVLINYSDLAASGATPHGIMLSTVMENNMTIVDYEQFLVGVKDACAEWGGQLLGGNIKEGSSFSVTGTSIGYINKSGRVLHRKGATEHDVVCVVGDPGMFWSAVIKLNKKIATLEQLDDYSKSFLLNPRPKLAEGELLSVNNAVTTCMDSSDGIIACLYELAEMNDKTICLQDDLLLPNPSLKDLCETLGMDYRNLMLSWGGWELVFTCNKDAVSALHEEFASNNLSFCVIGEVTEKTAHSVVLRKSNAIYTVDDFSNKRFDSMSSISFGIDKWIEQLTATHIKPIEI